MIGISCGSCKHFKDPKLITGYCEKWKKETPIFETCEYCEAKVVHKNEVLSKKREMENNAST